MSKSLRLSEKWFRRGLWLVALLFAAFLIGLGGTIVGDLPRVEHSKPMEDFLDAAAVQPLRAGLAQTEADKALLQDESDRLELQLNAARQANANAREAFANWVATRHVTQRADQDAELLKRNRELDALVANVASLQQQLSAKQQGLLAATQRHDKMQERMTALEAEANIRWMAENRSSQLRVFLYRLALTLPLLVLAGWLFARKRKSEYWPFVWGFIFFALFTFFVELVPYLPSYGGYVRYLVGIVITVLGGRYAIRALNQYLARQSEAEQLPDAERRKELSYDVALARLGKGVCPGCERGVDLKNTAMDFCPHCGISLFDHCGHCQVRKSSFSRFCHSCGSGAASGQ